MTRTLNIIQTSSLVIRTLGLKFCIDFETILALNYNLGQKRYETDAYY